MFDTSKPFEEGVECLRKREQTAPKTPVSLRNGEQTGARKTRSKPLAKDPGRMVADFGVRGGAWEREEVLGDQPVLTTSVPQQAGEWKDRSLRLKRYVGPHDG